MEDMADNVGDGAVFFTTLLYTCHASNAVSWTTVKSMPAMFLKKGFACISRKVTTTVTNITIGPRINKFSHKENKSANILIDSSFHIFFKIKC